MLNKMRWRPVAVAAAIILFLSIGYWLTAGRRQASPGKALLRLSAGTIPCQEQLELWQQFAPKIELEQIPGGDNMFDLMVQVSAGQGPDLFCEITANTLDSAVASGILADLTPWIPETQLAQLPPAVREYIQPTYIDGNGEKRKILALWPSSMQQVFIIYNRTLMAKNGVPEPSSDLTWDEYIAKAAKLNAPPLPREAAPACFGAIGVNAEMLLWQHGGDFFNRTGTECTLDRPEAVAAMAYYHQLIHRYRVEPVEAQSAWDQQMFRLELFMQGKVGMLWVSRGALYTLRRNLASRRNSEEDWQSQHPGMPYLGTRTFKIGACLPPRFKDGKRWVNMAVTGVGVNRKSRQPEAAREFLRFLGNAAYQDSFRSYPVGMPPMREFQNVEKLTATEYSGETEINATAAAAVNFSRVRARSLFVPDSYVEREWQQVRNAIGNDPQMTPERIAAQLRELVRKIHQKRDQTLAHDRGLRKAYTEACATIK